MNRPTDPEPGGGPGRRHEVDDLVRTIQSDAVRKQAPKEPRGPRKRSPLLYGALTVLVLGNAYIWIAQPAWITGGSGITTVEEAEGLLRFRMYVQAQRIQAYQRQHGTLPESLDQTGEPFEGITYRRTGPDSWELEGELQGARLVLPSSMPIQEFVESGDR
jgi:hypothetical protein